MDGYCKKRQKKRVEPCLDIKIILWDRKHFQINQKKSDQTNV